jgi:hypothetical protein
MSRPIPLSSYILIFEVGSVIVLPLLLAGMRRARELRIVAKLWVCVLILGFVLQAFMSRERTYTFPMRWSLEVPDEIRGQGTSRVSSTQKAVVFSRPALTEEPTGRHICYQVMYSEVLAKRLEEMHRDVVEVEYDVTFRFDTPLFYHSARLKGDDRNTTMGEMGFMSQGHGTSGYTCFPGPGLFE